MKTENIESPFNTTFSDAAISSRFQELLSNRNIERHGSFEVVKTAENIMANDHISILSKNTGETIDLSLEQFAIEMFPHPEDIADRATFLKDIQLAR